MTNTNEHNDFTNSATGDARLTAFALGELEGADRAEVEALVARDEGVRRAVEEIRATATLVAAELGSAGGPALTDDQRAKIAAKAAAKPVFRMRRVHWIAAAASVAAAATIVASTSAMRGKSATETAKVDFTRSENLYEDWDDAVPEAASGEFTFSGGSSANGKSVPASNTTIASDELEPLVGGAAGGGSTPYGQGAGGGGGAPGETTVNLVREGGAPSADPNAPPNLPSGETEIIDRAGVPDGSPGTGSPVVHHGAGKPSAWIGRRAGGGGAGGGGLGQPVAPPRRIQPAEPKAPLALPGPATPGGGGPTTGGPGAELNEEEADARLRLETLGYLSVDRDGSTAAYAHVDDNPFRLVKDAPLSTFGVDVDTASYSNVRRFLSQGQLPPPGAVRIEEMLNYFPYDYAPPTDGRPFAVRVDVAGCPWKSDHRLVRVGIKGKVVATAARPAANLVFLLDVSGSMQPANRLPLVLQSMKLLVGQLEARDRVAIVVYAGESGLALPSTSCEDKAKILAALDALHAGGSTNGAAGIQLAYDIAAQNRIDGGVNRVILATDGDFNVGVSDQSSLVTMIQEKAKSGTFLSVLGVGDDNLKDSTMEMLADRGNGNYAYIDTLKEGQKTLVEQTSGTLVTIAKDVKLQIEFNPSQVGAYRLIGYENRVLAAEDFKDDKKDAGEIGAGHTVTALYEVVPPGALATETVGVEPLKYQTPPAPAGGSSRELLTVKLRWKEPNSDVSTPMEVPVVDEGLSYSAASPDFKFAASVAAFGMCLRQSPHRGQANLDAILELAMEGTANDPGGYRKEFVEMVSVAKKLGAK